MPNIFAHRVFTTKNPGPHTTIGAKPPVVSTNAGATDTAYNFGNYIQTDGTNDEGNMASSYSVSSANDFVLSFWLKQAGGGASTNMICGDSANQNNYIMLRHGATPNVRFATDLSSGGSQDEWNSITWNNDTWHHFYFYNDSTTVKLVFDGVDKGNGGDGWNGLRINALFYRPVGTAFTSEAGIDDFIFTQATGSVAQAQSLYNSGAGKNPITALGGNPGLWYKMNIEDGETVVPNSGSSGSNDLILANFITPYMFSHE